MYLTLVVPVFCVAAIAQQAGDDSPTSLKAVEVFQRKATFVAKDRHLRFLEVNAPGEPKPVFRLNWLADLNCQIALAKENDRVIATDGKTIYRVSQAGQADTLATLGEVQPEGTAARGIGGSIQWFFATSDSRDLLFFGLSAGVKRGVCRLELETKKLKFIDFPIGAEIDVDVDTGVVIGPDSPTVKQILLKDFDGKIDKRFPTSTTCYLCRLDAEKRIVLLSNHDLQGASPIALLDIVTGQETVLPITGSHATWGDKNTVFFLRGSNSLWRFRVGDQKPTEVITVREEAAPGYGIVPLLSGDKTWLAWEWSSKTEDGLRNGTILIDLKNNEYRHVKGWWCNVQWLQDDCSFDGERGKGDK